MLDDFSYHVVVAVNSASASVDAAHPVLVVLDEALRIIRDVSFKRKSSIMRVLRSLVWWSITQFYSVDISKSRISIEKYVFQQTHYQGLRQVFLTVSWDL